MKKIICVLLLITSVITYGSASTVNDAVDPQKTTKAVKTTSSRTKTNHIKKRKSRKGVNFYKYSNRASYQKTMYRSMNGR